MRTFRYRCPQTREEYLVFIKPYVSDFERMRMQPKDVIKQRADEVRSMIAQQNESEMMDDVGEMFGA